VSTVDDFFKFLSTLSERTARVRIVVLLLGIFISFHSFPKFHDGGLK